MLTTGVVWLVVGCFAFLFFLIIWGVPVAISMLVSAMVGMIILTGSFKPGVHILTYTLQILATTHSYIVIPLFVLMGALAGTTGVAADFFKAANKLVGRIRGGLGIAVCFASAAFGALTGSTVSSTIIMTKVALPELKKFNYQSSFSLGIIASASTLAAMIPPSIMLVVYAILTEQSVGKLLVGGIVPGIMQAAIYSLFIWARASLQPGLAPRGQRYSLGESLRSLKDIIPLVGTLLGVMFGILFGLWTPVEGGAIGAITIALYGLLRRRLKATEVRDAGVETASTCGIIFILIVGSICFSKFLAASGVTEMLISAVIAMNVSPFVFFLMLLGAFTVLGCFIEGIAMEALSLPILMPVILMFGWDPVWFGIIMTKLVQVATLTPPVGLNLYALKSAAPNENFTDIARGCLPFWTLEWGILLLLYFVPQIVLWLPSMTG